LIFETSFLQSILVHIGSKISYILMKYVDTYSVSPVLIEILFIIHIYIPVICLYFQINFSSFVGKNQNILIFSHSANFSSVTFWYKRDMPYITENWIIPNTCQLRLRNHFFICCRIIISNKYSTLLQTSPNWIHIPFVCRECMVIYRHQI
jgi:hypothetical protein